MIKRYGFLILLVVVGLVWLGKYLYSKPKFVHGEVAPDFNMTLLDGRSMNFYDLKGNYILLDFWGSWCAPCRQENPSLVKLYDEFHGKVFKKADGFEIVSIALEMKESRWKAAIAKDDLHWPYHHADFDRMNSPIGKKYGVREIPTKYLITSDGYIAGVNMTYEEIKSFLTSRLKG
jgi:thiol-disulfide isomerase/thioredoxin